MNAKNIEDIYPLSPMQQGMLFHSLYETEKAVYFEQSSWKLKGRLDIDAFQQAWQAVLDRYTALRTSFIWEGLDEPMQVVHRKLKMPVIFFDWQEYDAVEQQQRLEVYLQQEQERGFDLEAPPLMRIAIIQNAPEECVFVWSHHHLLLDGWTQAVLIHDLLTLYQAKAEGRSINLPAAQPYRNYISWLVSQDKEAAEDFWRSALAGFSSPVSLQDVLGELHPGGDEEKMEGWQEDYELGAGPATRGYGGRLAVFGKRTSYYPQHDHACCTGPVDESLHRTGRYRFWRNRLRAAGGSAGCRDDGGLIHQHIADPRRGG